MTRRRRTHITALAAGAVALAIASVAAGCVPATENNSAPDAATLERFYEQELAWEACDDYTATEADAELFSVVETAECARLAVPIDYDDPDGEEASVAVLRMPARGEAIGSLVTNPGGPGSSGLIGAISAAAGLVESPISQRFDIVGFDPRGVGATRPAAHCFSSAEADTGSFAMGPAGTTEELTSEDTRAIFEACARGSGGEEALEHMGTRDTARDMDVLRAALGDDELTFLGQSYGTRLGSVYAEEFPERVRAMVLDGARDPNQGTMETRTAAYAGFQAAFDALAAQCAEQVDCPLGQDPSRATEEFQRIMQTLHDEPVPALETTLDFDAAIGGVIAGLYSPDRWERIIDGIAEVEQGRGDELLTLVYEFGARSPSGEWPNTEDANTVINCMDEDRLTPEQGIELRERTFREAPFMDPGFDETPESHDGCEHWKAEPTLGFPYAQHIKDLSPTLVVSITGDPTTPHEGGIALADTLGASLLTVQGQGHTIVAGGTNACVDEIASAYLIDLELPDEGATCTMG